MCGSDWFNFLMEQSGLVELSGGVGRMSQKFYGSGQRVDRIGRNYFGVGHC